MLTWLGRYLYVVVASDPDPDTGDLIPRVFAIFDPHPKPSGVIRGSLKSSLNRESPRFLEGGQWRLHMRTDNLFVKAIVVERDDGGFYIRLRDRLAARPDYCVTCRFASRVGGTALC